MLNMPGSKVNQAMKFDQLIKKDMVNILLLKQKKWDGRTSHRFFSKNLKLSISLDQQSEIL